MSRNDTVVLRQIQSALKRGKMLSNDQVIKLAELNRANNVDKHHVGVAKVDLREGEELMDFAWTMMSAVQTDRIVLADGSLDAWLIGIFNDHVVVEDGNTGRLFRADFSRNDKGEIAFSEPVEVRQVFVPVERDENGVEVEKSANRFERIVEVSKRGDDRKWSFLPRSITRR